MKPDVAAAEESTFQDNRSCPDSLTFGQLKKIVAQQTQKPKQSPKYAFEYADTDTLKSEIDEWFLHDQLNYCLTCRDAFVSLHGKVWKEQTAAERQALVNTHLVSLEFLDFSIASVDCSILCYLAQGVYGESLSVDHQIQLILENARLFGSNKAFITIFKALQAGVETYFDTCEAFTSTVGPHMEGVLENITNLMTILYLLLEASRAEPALEEEVHEVGESIAVYLMEQISRSRQSIEAWPGSFPVAQLVLLLWKVLLITLGGRKHLGECKRWTRQRHNLPTEVDKSEIVTTPLEYAAFRSDLISKYPSFAPPPTVLPLLDGSSEVPSFVSMTVPPADPSRGQWIATPAPSPPASPKPGKKSTFQTNQTLPFLLPLGITPASIKEASSLFTSRIRTSLPVLQLWQEQERFMHGERAMKEDFIPEFQYESKEAKTLSRAEAIYARSLPHLQSFCVAMMDLTYKMAHENLPAPGFMSTVPPKQDKNEDVAQVRTWLFNDKSETEKPEKTTEELRETREFEILLKAVSAVLILLLKWFRASHVLKFEYLSQLLLDANWIQVFHYVLMSLDPQVSVTNSNELVNDSYFAFCAKTACYEQSTSDDDCSMNQTSNKLEHAEDDSANPQEPYLMTKYSWRNFFSSMNFLQITQKIVKKKTHRNFLLVQAKTWLHLRKSLRIPHDKLQLYILKLYKGQVPLCPRKWRSNNMKVITLIYLNCKPELREDWIAGTEVESDPEEALVQEEALRALVQCYNQRKYPQEMDQLGFDSQQHIDDFFSEELSKLGL